MSVTFRAALARRLGRTPSAINAVQTAGAEGMFVPTGTGDRWIYAREWHPERGETLADWTPQRRVELIRAGTGLDTGAALVRPDRCLAWRSSAPPAEAVADLRRGVDLVLGRPAPLLAKAG